MFKIRKTEDKDIESLINLFRISFGKKITPSYWLWKYHNSPWGAVSYVVTYQKKLIAHYGGIKLKFQYKGDILWAYQFCDVMTHPDYRAKIFTKYPPIIQAGKRFYMEYKMDFAFGFPSERHAKLQSLALKGEGFKRICLFEKDINHKNNQTKCLKKYNNYSIEILSKLWQATSKYLCLSIVKDSKYLKWRYYEHPDNKYFIIPIKKGILKKICGICIVSTNEDVLNILDFFLYKKENFKIILSKIEKIAIKCGYSKIKIWLNPLEIFSTDLINFGYKITEHIPYSVRILNKNKDIQFYNKYCYRMGDYDAS